MLPRERVFAALEHREPDRIPWGEHSIDYNVYEDVLGRPTLVQAKMFHSIASIYGQPMSGQRIAEISGTLGLGFAARMAGREAFKLIPGVGSAVAALFASASTYALGCTLCAYFSFVRDGDVPQPDVLRRLYEEQYQEGRRRLRAYLERMKRPRAAGS